MTICPNCKREDTMVEIGDQWGVCGSCGWRGSWNLFGYVKTPKTDPYAVARGMGERMRAVYDAYPENGE